MSILTTDLNPTATSNDKDLHIKVVRLTFADFTTAGVAAVKAILPADASIVEISSWKETQFSGNGITAATLSVGIPGTPTKFVTTADVFTAAAGTQGHLTPITNIMQHDGLPLGADIPLLFTGTATTGNPTAGEFYVKIVFVR